MFSRSEVEMPQSNPKTARRPKPRRFYILGAGSNYKLADFDVTNLDVLLPENAGALAPPQGRRGFPSYVEKPNIVIGLIDDRKTAVSPSDIEPYHAYWL